MEKSVHFMHLLKHTGDEVFQREWETPLSSSGKNAGILKNMFSLNRIKPPQPGGFVVAVLELKIVMKQLLLVNWMFCFHFKILLLSLELFLFRVVFFFSIMNSFLNTFHIKRKKQRNTNFQIWQNYYCHMLSLWQHEPPWAEVSSAGNGHICKQTLKPHEKG